MEKPVEKNIDNKGYFFGVKGLRLYFCTPKSERVKEQVDLVAQLVEHNTFNVGALGSSPSGITQQVARPAFLLQFPSS